MSAALFITLQREIPGIDASTVSGKALSRNLDWLNQVCKQSKVRTMDELISLNPRDVAEFLRGEGEVPDGLSLPQEQWFEPEDGLRTIGALLEHSESVKATERSLLEDLRACKRVLEAAQQHHVRFHFSVDF
jgi:hypothetical protein